MHAVSRAFTGLDRIPGKWPEEGAYSGHPGQTKSWLEGLINLIVAEIPAISCSRCLA